MMEAKDHGRYRYDIEYGNADQLIDLVEKIGSRTEIAYLLQDYYQLRGGNSEGIPV